MTRHVFAALVLFAAAGPAPAVIKKLTPLKEVVAASPVIVAAEVGRIDPDRPAVVFTVKDHLKGKCEFDSLPVNLAGDSFAKKDNHTKVLLDRLAPARRLVLFLAKERRTYTVFGYLEGTWFQVQGTADPDRKAVRWAFLHCEPYFRRTFKGSTAELRAAVEKAVAGTAEPPPPDEKEPPGYGPLPEKSGRAFIVGPVYAVIPTVVFIGPLAILAALFPGVFARLAIGLVTWRAFLTVASVNSTLALVYFWVRGYLPDARWAEPQAIALLLVAVTAVGLMWAGRRYRRLAVNGPEVTAPPGRAALLVLVGLTAALGLMLLGTGWYLGRAALVELPWREFTAVVVGLAVATVYSLYRAATAGLDPIPPDRPRLSLSAESVGLFGVLAFTLATLVPGGSATVAPLAGETNDISTATAGPKLTDVRVFTLEDATEILSGVAVGPDGRLYAGGSKETALSGFGRVVCFDPITGREVWRFTDDGGLKPVYCTPTVAGGRVYVGEGLHTDADRRLFCLDAATGKPVWQVPTASHTEGRPAVVGDRVVFSAGDDGLVCVDATGKPRWHFPGLKQKLHIDTPPTVAGGRVFFGSGYNTLALLCADLETGAEVWRTPVGLRSFGPLLVIGDRVFAGLGTGNLVDDLSSEPEDGVPDEKTPAGAVVCLDTKTGTELWRRELPKSVHTSLAGSVRSVFACCKDGSVYALNRRTGAVQWRRQVGESFAAGPALTAGVLYAVTADGRAAALDPVTGEPFWFRPLAEPVGKNLKVFSTPVVVPSADGLRRMVYFGAAAENRNNGAKAAVLVLVEDEFE